MNTVSLLQTAFEIIIHVSKLPCPHYTHTHAPVLSYCFAAIMATRSPEGGGGGSKASDIPGLALLKRSDLIFHDPKYQYEDLYLALLCADFDFDLTQVSTRAMS